MNLDFADVLRACLGAEHPSGRSVCGLILWGLLGAWLAFPIVILLLFFVPGECLPVMAAYGVMGWYRGTLTVGGENR